METKESITNSSEKSSKRLPKQLTVYLPENLDLDKLVKEKPPKEKIPAFNKDYIAYILHLITYLPLRLKDYDYDANAGFVPINKQKLQSKIYHYRKYINYLVGCGIIEEKGQYIVGEKSGGMKFTQQYCDCKVKRYNIIKYTLIKAILSSSNENEVKVQEKYPYLAKWWKSDKLHIDFPKAKKFLDDKLQKNIDPANKDADMHPYEKYNSAFIVIDKINRRDYLMKVDTTSGRFHSLLTQLPKDLRQYLSFDGKKLTSIDLVNSQPLLITALLDVDILINNPIILQTISRYNSKYEYKLPSDRLKDFIAENQDNQDVLDYRDITSKGQYYETFAQDLISEGIINTNEKEPRKLAKEATFSAFYAPNRYISVLKPMRHFKARFPTVYKIFYKIKEGRGNERDTHKALSISMQALEAELFLDKICRCINEVNPDIPMFTIHDSIITTAENKDIVIEIVECEIYRAIILKPKVHVEDF